MGLSRREAIIATAAPAAPPGPARAAQPIAAYTAACVHTRVIPTITETGADADALKANVDTTIATLEKGASEIGRSNVYRVDPATGAVTAVVTDMIKPNGLAFSLDEQQLYIADTGHTHGAQYPRHIRVFDVQGDRLGGGRVFAESTAGLFDGFRLDVEGRIWTSAEDGVHCYEPDGTLIGKILVPEVVANVCFGGLKRNRLYICATTSLYAVYVMTNGAKTY